MKINRTSSTATILENLNFAIVKAKCSIISKILCAMLKGFFNFIKFSIKLDNYTASTEEKNNIVELNCFLFKSKK